MKTTLTLLLLILCSSALLAQKNDTIVKVKKRQFFIGIDAGAGIGWRINKKNIPDSAVFVRIDSKGEEPGIAYNLGIIFGLNKKRFRFSIGIEYNHVEYKNDSYYFYGKYDSMRYDGRYKLKHQIISVPLKINYQFAHQNWQLGLIIKPGWLSGYGYLKINPTRKFGENDYRYLNIQIGASIGRKIFETKKFSGIIYIEGFISTKISGENYQITHAKYKALMKPHYLLNPRMTFNFQIKK